MTTASADATNANARSGRDTARPEYTQRQQARGSRVEACDKRAGTVPVECPPDEPRIHPRRRVRYRSQFIHHLDGNGIGVDHNPDSIATVRGKGFSGFTIEDISITIAP